jgi:hypothetical protein
MLQEFNRYFETIFSSIPIACVQKSYASSTTLTVRHNLFWFVCDLSHAWFYLSCKNVVFFWVSIFTFLDICVMHLIISSYESGQCYVL